MVTAKEILEKIYRFAVKFLAAAKTNNKVLLVLFIISISFYSIFVKVSADKEETDNSYPAALTPTWLIPLVLLLFSFYILRTKLIHLTALNHDSGGFLSFTKYLPPFLITLATTTVIIFFTTSIISFYTPTPTSTPESNDSTTSFAKVMANIGLWVGSVFAIIFTIYSAKVDFKYTKQAMVNYKAAVMAKGKTLHELNTTGQFPNITKQMHAKLTADQSTKLFQKITPPESLTDSYTVFFGFIFAIAATFLGLNIYKKGESNKPKKSITYVLQFLVCASIASFASIQLFQMILKMFYIGFFNFIGKPIDPSKYKNSTFHRILLVLTIIGVIMLGAQFAQASILLESGKKENDTEFEENRCNITNMILFSYLKPNTPKYKNMTFSQNWNNCMHKTQKVFLMTFLQPFYDIFKSITDIISIIFTNITDIRQAITNIRVYFSNMTQELYKKMRDDYIRLSYLKNVFVRIFSKVFDGMYNMFYAVLFTYYTLRSILSPVLPIANFFCFSPDTKITSTKTIAEYKINDTLPDGSKVLTTMCFSSKNVKMYNYKGTIVAGSHLAFNTASSPPKFQRVEDIPGATPLPSSSPYPHDHVICLRTSSNAIVTHSGTKFADYDETSNPVINAAIQKTIIAHLNDTYQNTSPPNTSPPNTTHPDITNNRDALPFHHWAFHPQTIVDGKPISKYKIGDKLPSSDGATVTGIIKTKPHNIHYYHGIFVTGNQIVLDPTQNLYCQVSQTRESHQLTTSQAPNVIYYNLTTSNNKLVIKGFTFTDFEQSSDPHLNEAIDNLVENYKNHNLIQPYPSPFPPKDLFGILPTENTPNREHFNLKFE